MGRTAQRKIDFSDDPKQQKEVQDSKNEVPVPVSKKRPSSTQELRSPTKKRQAVATVVTPEKATPSRVIEKDDYSPSYVHKNVEYTTEGSSKVSETTRQVFAWIVDRYEIPRDLEQKRKYGPLSGSCYEDRVIQQYTLGKLKRLEEAPDEENKICSECAEVGHRRDECPTLV